MARHRSESRSHCPINFTAEILGDPWSLLVLRDVVLYAKTRFGELLDSEERIATNILSDRLARLVDAGILEKSQRPTAYSITERGLDLIPLLLEMSAWGARHDPKTAAPPEFLEAFQANKKAVFAAVRRAAEEGRPWSPTDPSPSDRDRPSQRRRS